MKPNNKINYHYFSRMKGRLIFWSFIGVLQKS